MRPGAFIVGSRWPRPVVLSAVLALSLLPAVPAFTDGGAGVFVFSVPFSGTYVKRGDEEEQRIGFIQGRYVAPRLAGDGKRLLLQSERGGKLGVWMASGGDWRMERVCDGDQAEWSPDGKRIVFRRGGAIMERDLAGGRERTVSPPDWSSCRFPSYFPDGRILFVSTGEKGDAISVASLEGGASLELLSGAEVNSTPKCSPDGGRLAYQDGAHIRLMEFPGGKTTRLTMAGGVQSWPLWSRDGKTLCYCQSPGWPDGPWDVMMVSVGSPQSVRLVRRGVHPAPDWNGLPPETGEAVPVKGGGALWGRGEKEWGNDWLRLAVKKDGGLSIAPKEGARAGDGLKLYLLDGFGRKARVKPGVWGDAEGVALEADEGGGAVFVFGRCSPLVGVKLSATGAGVRIEGRMELAVVPDHLASDLVYSPRIGSATTLLPATPVLLACLPKPGGLAVIVAPGRKMTLERAGRGGPFTAVRVAGGEGNIFVALLPGPDAWREAKVVAARGGKGWEAAFSAPFSARWRLATAGNLVAGPPASLAAAGSKAAGPPASLAAYSQTWDEDALAALKKPVLSFDAPLGRPGPSVIYPESRSWHTPPSVFTPSDIVREALGLGGAWEALDERGVRGYRAARKWVPFLEISTEDEEWDIYSLHTKRGRELGVIEVMGGARNAATPGIRSLTAHLSGDIMALLEGLDDRRAEYAEFLVRLGEFCRSKAKSRGWRASIILRLEALRERAGKMPVTPLADVAAALDGLRAALPTDGGGHEILYHHDGFNRVRALAVKAQAERQAVLAEYRGFARMIREEAGRVPGPDPALAGEAGEVRAMAGGVLRLRYYLEGDWRGGEPLGTESGVVSR